MGRLKLIVPVIVFCILQEYTSGQGYVPSYLKNKFNLAGSQQGGGVKTSFTKTKTKTKTGGYNHGASLNMGVGGFGLGGNVNLGIGAPVIPHGIGSQTGSYSGHLSYGGGMGGMGGQSGNGIKYKGGCSQPPSPMNAGLTCSQYSGCKVSCMPSYQFPNGESELFIKCESGNWIVEGAQFTTIPSCEPVCLPVCQNNGICIAPNQCNCPNHFSGPQCQYENKPCMALPNLPMNARRKCSSSTCTVSCLDGHQFPDGSGIAQMVCKNGLWVPEKDKWVTIPDCQATCNPPCQNGGNCLSFNVCQCPQDFRGPQCQYETEVCSPKRIQFNGGYNCSGSSDHFKCSLSCPEGIKFSFKPESHYTCYYSKGVFEPTPVPQCVYPDNVRVLEGPATSETFLTQLSNSSGYNMNSISVNGQYLHGGMPHTKTKNKFEYTRPDKFFNDSSNIQYVPLSGNKVNQLFTLEQKLPKPGTCFTWGGAHHKTFDGKIFSFNSKCPHVLVRDAVDNTFSIVVQNNEECYFDPTTCHRIIKIYLQDKEFYLKRSDKGLPIFGSGKKFLPIPGQLPGLRVEMVAHYIVISLDTLGTKIKWDGAQLVQAEVTEGLWNRTEGLCGKIDGDITNDFVTKDGIVPKTIATLASSWKVDDLENTCNDEPSETHACKDNGIKGSKQNKATKFCKKLLADPRFDKCKKVLDTSALLDACTWDYCSCKNSDPTECACETLNVYIRDCARNGITGLANWRDEKTCPMRCTGGRIYKACGPSTGQAVCGAVTVLPEENQECVEGCYCPEGTVLHNNKCITKDKCPCRLRGKNFPPGSTVPKECNTCTCNEGQWICTEISCGARCSAIGDPHYTTFDGKSYDFMGQCNYYLVKNDNFTVEAENVACAGAISQAMNFPVSVSSGLPSCTKTVTIRINGHSIKLKQNHDLVVDGQDITTVPYEIAGVKIRIVSSIFLIVELPNGVEIWWDGVTRVYIDVPPTLQGKTKGLCGTFNNNQKDDFLTPEDDIEHSVVPFANKWKTQEKCNDVPEKIPSHPCDKNIHKKSIADKHCHKLKTDLFKDCHFLVDPEQFYQNCLYDMCSCEFKVSSCLCPILSGYATECSRNGVKIDWRNDIRECGIHCPGGQKYQVCGNSCTRTCADISARPDCKQQCVEGCNCPEGEALDELGECIPIGECKCQYEGIDFPAGYREVRPASRGPELCTCLNANWVCKPASPEELKDFPRAHDLKSRCNSSINMEFTTCEPVEPVTCKNMHNQEPYTSSVCHSGCKCKEGYVLDSRNKKCVKPENCPCQHGGISYKENSIVQSDCNTCTCKNGKWKCTERQCTAECSAWGDSHYKTFDGKQFDYQGQCDYVLAKGSLTNDDSFDVTIQNVPCGSLGTSCSKSITIRVGSGGEHETLTLTKEKPLPQYQTLKHLSLRQSGIFVIVEALDLGLTVHWDKGTRVYVKVDPRWKNKIKGLCGNYNNNDADDFQTPSGGVIEASANIFGDSWRLQSYCPEALEVTNTCEDRPDRKIWALKKCGVLKSSVFAPCHREVPLEPYFDKCVFDTCACDQGGDCECLCTALSAYAQECNNKGVPIKWRTQQLCPMQCDERCSTYSPCISTCPAETCDNLLDHGKLSKSCGEDSCVEGCNFKPCPPGKVYSNSSHLECVPRTICKPICLEINGVSYYEGDLVEEDDCHSCYCSRGKKQCTGQPCTTTIEPLFTTPLMEQPVQCAPGWTEWINQDKPKHVKTKTKGRKKEVEPIPSSILMNSLQGPKCSFSQMANIECRTVGTHIPSKKTGLDVECSLEKGLVCQAEKGRKCPDFEIRVFCECDYIENPVGTTEPPICDASKPHQEHPTDCHLFYHCTPDSDGNLGLVEKSCGKDMMYNPQTMTCDWPSTVTALKPSCAEEISIVEPEIPECPPGMVKEPCAIRCENLCLYYSFVLKEQGLCQTEAKCESGCVSAEKKLECPEGKYWANNETCVSMFDCMCKTFDGRPVKPGQVVEESGCRHCQCIDNYYTCHKVLCEEEEESRNEADEETEDFANQILTVEPGRDHEIRKEENQYLESAANKPVSYVTIPSIVIIPTTVTPPEVCDESRYINLIQGDQPLPDEAFSASSVLSPPFVPSNARLHNKITETSGGNWAPEFSNQDQYLEVDLGRAEPVYGVIVQGSPLYEEYVTSYQVMYSPDGKTFFYVLNDEKHPQVFRGSIDQRTPVKQIFDVPFEAKKIRINPQTWNNGISLRLEIIGCGEPQTTTAADYITASTLKPVKYCDDELGYGDGTMSDQQVLTSSDLSPDNDKTNLKITGLSAWRPLSNSPTEWVQFDFLEPRNVTGLVTRGGDKGWVTAYTIKYSHNGKDWNPILNNNQKEKIFLGNFDNNSPQKVQFDLPISTRYVKIVPVKWQDNIQMRIEMHGCYKPYPEIEEPLTTVEPSPCNICPGVKSPELELDACKCLAEAWWDGEHCVNRTQCPCMVGHIPYSVGAVFEKEDCSECICKLGGVSYCTPKKCGPCSEGLRSTVTSTCACTCKPCPEDTVLCPTSNICINSTLWCNGVQDCPDDELNCPTTILIATTTLSPTTTKKPKTCPIVECQPGFKKTERKSKVKNLYLSPMLATQGKPARKTFFKGSYKGVKIGGVKGGYRRPNLLRPTIPPPMVNDEEEIICKEYTCVSSKIPPKFIHSIEECPAVICQPNYVPVFDFDVVDYNECPRYSCHPPPPRDSVCNITGRTFNTFDETEYKYDICNHVIARDLENDEWDIALKKNCSKSCNRDLIIRHKDHNLIIHPDLTVELDGFLYTKEQIKKMGTTFSEFSIQQLGNTLSFESNRYGFWIIWNKLGNVKLGVVHKLLEKVDGLCGYFNGIPEDDKRKPDGAPARTTVEFGDSWAMANDQPLICEAKACPIHIQNKAWEICNKVKDRSLAPCAKVVDIEAFVSRCLETTCACLESSGKNHTAEEECRCQTTQNFVVDCLTADSNIDLSDWRMQHDCPITCEAPLVYHDCYQRKCEPTCRSISDPNLCPKVPNICFPGCYCPAGYVRKDDTCIKPSSCRDCECNVLPHLQYVTYDESNFTVTGNCVYVMSRDVLLDNDKHLFQVLVTNSPCQKKPDKMCVGKITILFKGHKIHVLMDYYRNKLKLIVDGERVYDFSEVSDWLSVRETPAKHLKILLPELQVETSVYFPSLGVSVKAPSHKYGGKLEGICGNCNGNPNDDFQTPTGAKPKDDEDFALSWLYENLPGGQSREQCENKPQQDCPPIPIDSDPCVQLIDVNKFGQCLPFLDPSLFIEWCRKDTCGGHPELACTAIETYARDCAGAGFCINWRTDLCQAKACPPEQIYDPCGTSCPKTCQNIKGPQKPCKNVPVEGCYCPEGKVLLNDTCVIPKDCEVCDNEGHHPGDKWKKDKCTTCTCEGTALKCETQSCPGSDAICERGYNAIKLPAKDNECCDKYACVPEPTAGPTCPPPQKLVCGPGQILKLDTKPNGCGAFICECKPKEECEPIDLTTEKPLEDGLFKEVDDNGCCPVVNIVCKPELCPDPKACPQYHSSETKEIEGKCCPIHTCEPPKDKCIFDTEYIAATKGGERLLTKYEKQKVLKNGNETWNDGPCRECKCILTSTGTYQQTCSKTDCPPIEIHIDFPEFELILEETYGECCPLVKRTGCKHKGQVFKVGEKWPIGTDYCTTMECVEIPNGIQKETHKTTCDTDCDLGSVYVPPTKESKECCGSCKPVACVVDGVVHEVDAEWSSPDYCTKYCCKNINGSMQVQSVLVNCAELSLDYKENFEYEIIPVEGECCKKHKTTACKVGDKVYKVGEIWPSPDGDKCKTFTCVEKPNGDLLKQASIETCKKECAKGWEYKESDKHCCGKCVQVACVVEDELKKPGENWTSADNCTLYTCDILDDQFVVSSQQESCPSLEDCPEENIYVKGCCKHCNLTAAAQTLCTPEAIPLDKTVGLITHGKCVNKEPIKNFTECVGTCHSSTMFNFKSGMHESICECCQATAYNQIKIELVCENGSIHHKTVAVPSKCGCEGCSASSKANSFTKTHVKGVKTG